MHFTRCHENLEKRKYNYFQSEEEMGRIQMTQKDFEEEVEFDHVQIWCLRETRALAFFLLYLSLCLSVAGK